MGAAYTWGDTHEICHESCWFYKKNTKFSPGGNFKMFGYKHRESALGNKLKDIWYEFNTTWEY